MDKSSSLGCPCNPKKYPRGTSINAWGCPRHPLLHQQNIRSFLNTLYFYCFICYVLFLEHLYLVFSLFCFVCCNKWLDPIIHVLENTHSVLIAWNTLVFTLIVPRVFQFFQYCVQLLFPLLFCSEHVSFLYFHMFSSLYFVENYL